MPTYTYTCDECGTTSHHFFKFEGRPDGLGCECGGIAHYRLDAPAVVGKASFLDGHKRKGWADLKEANKLSREAAVSRKETAKELRNEIKKMKVRVEQ